MPLLRSTPAFPQGRTASLLPRAALLGSCGTHDPNSRAHLREDAVGSSPYDLRRYNRFLECGFDTSQRVGIETNRVGVRLRFTVERAYERPQVDVNRLICGVLERSEANLAEAQRLSHTGSWHLNVSTGEVVWSKEFLAVFGFDPEKTKASYSLNLERIHPEKEESHSDNGKQADHVLRPNSGRLALHNETRREKPQVLRQPFVSLPSSTTLFPEPLPNSVPSALACTRPATCRRDQ